MIITTDGEIFSKELIASSAVARNSPTWGGFRPEMEIIGKEANSLAWPNSVFPEPMMRKKPTGIRRKTKDGLNLLTVKEAAEALHQRVPVSAIYRAINDGRLHATKIGRFYYISYDTLERFIECPDQKNQPDSGSAATMGRGSSSTKDAKSGLASVMDFVNRQKIS